MHRLLLISMILAFVTYGCGSDDPASPADPPDSLGEACYPNSTCDQDLMCVNGFCVPATASTPDANQADSSAQGDAAEDVLSAEDTLGPETADTHEEASDAEPGNCENNEECPDGNCIGGVCVPFHCFDGVMSSGETGLDCGGVCPFGCEVGSLCNVDNDCATSCCTPDFLCEDDQDADTVCDSQDVCPGQDDTLFAEGSCSVCKDTHFTGLACDECANAWEGEDCSECPENWSGENCDQCAGNFSGDGCETCTGMWGGENCDLCPANWSGAECNVCTGRGCIGSALHRRWALDDAGSIICGSADCSEIQLWPDGPFFYVSPRVGMGGVVCGLNPDKTMLCWKAASGEIEDSPSGTFRQVEATVDGSELCALRTDNTIVCWPGAEWIEPQEGTFSYLSGGYGFCWIAESGYGTCKQGPSYSWSTDVPVASISSGGVICAVTTSGEVVCDNEKAIPDGQYQMVAVNGTHTCALQSSGSYECWKWSELGEVQKLAVSATEHTTLVPVPLTEGFLVRGSNGSAGCLKPWDNEAWACFGDALEPF